MAEGAKHQPDGKWLFCWLHVSDIHMGHGTASWQYDQQEVLDALVDDVKQGINEGRIPPPDVVLCTGDIGNTGGVNSGDEYKQAGEWLQRLMDETGARRLFGVPGNHDIQRTPPAQLDAWRLLRDLRSGADLDASRRYDADRELLDARLACFRQFCACMRSPVPPDSLGAWTELVVDGQVGVRLIGFNSSSLCNDDEDKATLAVATSARLEAKREVRDSEIALVLMHHPPEWLAPSAHAKIMTMLEAAPSMAVLLHGHLHQQSARRAITTRGDELVTLAAGAVHDDDGPAATHAYNVAGIWLGSNGQLWLRYWPRRYENGRFHDDAPRLPDGARFADIMLVRPQAAPAGGEDPIVALSNRQLRELGSRRTAFPTDLSIAELRKPGLLVGVRLAATDDMDVDVAELAKLVRSGNSALVLGPPGAGKTVLAYQLSTDIREQGGLPLIVDLRTVGSLAESPEDLLGALGVTDADLVGHEPVVIVDGLDETLAGGIEAAEVARRLRGLMRLGGVVATCRESDYVHQLAATGVTNEFNMVCRLRPWRAEHEFVEFVRRLADAGLIAGTGLIDVVAGDRDLEALVSRPLYARMLTYVAEEGAVPEQVSTLYGQYLGKLSVRVAENIERADCRLPKDVLALWRDTAWTVHVSGLAADDLPLDSLIGALHEAGLDAGCAWQVLSPILDIATSADNRAAFVHYSFYEHLVAQHAHQSLIAGRAAGDAEVPTDVFAADLPREIRQQLTALLRRSVLDAYSWPAWLAGAYMDATGNETVVRTVRNLIAYVVCRLQVPFAAQLRPLLEAETDKFLRNSLMWALVRGDDRVVLETFVSELHSDPELASLNRGYLLYYFGDLPRTAPPYPDDDPTVSWEQTREQVSERFARIDYVELAPARRVIDIYTFADLAYSRGERLQQHEAQLLDSAVAALPTDLPQEAIARLISRLDEVRP